MAYQAPSGPKPSSKIRKFNFTEDLKGPIHIGLVGDGLAGKASLCLRITENILPDHLTPPSFENFYTKATSQRDSRTVIKDVVIHDNPGQNDHDRTRSKMYPEVDIVILFFSIDHCCSLGSIYDKVSRLL
jgi:GTPase SAR1 family protein